MSDLSDLFKLVAEEKKKKKDEFDSVVGDLGLDSLFGEFSALKKKEKEKKIEEKKKEESIIGEITLDSVFEEVANLKKETKKKKVKEEKTVKAFEKWLYSETTKEQEQIIEDVIEESLEEVLEVLEDHKEELEEPKEELIEKSLGLLAEPSDVKQQNDPITPLDQKFATLDDLQKHYSTFLSRIQQQLSTLGGGGETRLRYLDDVVGIATNPGSYNKGLLEWNSTTNSAKFEALDVILVDETLDTVTDRGNTTTNGIGVSFVNLPVGSVISGVSSIVANITRANLSSVLEYGDSANLGIGSYGLTYGITGGNYAVYELQVVPSPTLQIGDIIAGAGISVGSAIIGIGTGTYNKVIITDKTFPVGAGASPIPYDTIINFARAVVNPGLSIATQDFTDITLNAGAGGNIVNHSDILPYVTNVWSLGSPARRFKEIWFGTGTIYVQDETLGNDQALGAKGGNFYIKGGAGLEVGEWILRDNTLQIKDSTRDVYIGSLGATADVIFNRAVRVENAVNRTAFYTDRTGRTQFYPPTIPAGDIGGVSIIGSPNGAYQPVLFPGGLLHLTSNQDAPARVTIDGFGVASHAQLTGRSGRGTAGIPTALQSGDSMFRITAVGWGTTTIPQTAAPTAIEFVARENYTNTAYGSQINFYTAPLGTATKTLSASINNNGVVITGSATTTSSPLSLTGSITGAATSTGMISVGQINYTDTNNLAVFVDNVNNYSQFVVQNKNSGNQASTDFIVSNDLSGATNYYGDFGVNSSTFTGGGPFDEPNGVYLYSSYGSLCIGTKDIDDFRIATGITTDNPTTRLTVKGITGYIGIATVTPTAFLHIGPGGSVAGSAPLKLSAGTKLATPEAGTIEYDGNVIYSTRNDGARGVIPSEQFVVLSGIHTLGVQTAAQSLFDGDAGPPGGALYTETGTYFFECVFHLESMSNTNSTFGFALGGNATKTQGWQSFAYKSSTLKTPSSPGITWNTEANTNLTSNSIGTQGFASIKGTIRVTVPGTIIPQVSLTAAAAAIMQPNSYFKISAVGTATTTYVGRW